MRGPLPKRHRAALELAAALALHGVVVLEWGKVEAGCCLEETFQSEVGGRVLGDAVLGRLVLGGPTVDGFSIERLCSDFYGWPRSREGGTCGLEAARAAAD